VSGGGGVEWTLVSIKIVWSDFIKKDYDVFFRKITGFQPYNFQKEIASKILSGKNIIVQAPTGSGKTWASIIPFLFAKNMGIFFPNKLIYSLPLRTLANSLYESVSENEIIKQNNIKVSLQTGENPGDRFFESDIIFTTIDQTLSSVLGFPYSLPQRLANINAGAVISSYLIFDEVHLLDPRKSFATCSSILKKTKDITPFCLMTATFSQSFLENLAKSLDAEIVKVTEEEVKMLANYASDKIVNIDSGVVSSDKIIKCHKNRSIVIANTVDRCQEIYSELIQEKKLQNTEIICIHSRFFHQDRQEKEDRIKTLFNKDSKGNAILISTQVIEVGIDISCEVMHTEISPINSLLQRVGRCARFKNENGEVYVYDVKSGNNGSKNYLPYEKNLCKNTYLELEKINGETLDYFLGKKIIDKVLVQKELEHFETIQIGKYSQISESWFEKDKRLGRDLIRDINSVNVIIAKNLQIDSPFNFEMLSVNPYSLKAKLNSIQTSEEDWLAATIQENNFIIDSDDELYKVAPVGIDQIQYFNPIVLNNNYISYNKDIGLIFCGNDLSFESQKVSKEKKIPRYSYQKDTYQEHIEAMLTVYEQNLKRFNYFVFSKIESNNQFNVSLDELIKFVIILHDYGKLNKKWQNKAVEFQRTKNYEEGEILAHTDFDADKDKRPDFPPHAGIGAMVAFSIVEELVEDDIACEILAKAVSSAIIQHHSVKTHKTIPYEVMVESKNLIIELLRKHCPNLMNFDLQNEVLIKWDISETFDDYMVKYDDYLETFLYFIFVRTLRLCDQKSFDVMSG
jgi:CRISPR-associated endonuclease/helicase Cas3